MALHRIVKLKESDIGYDVEHGPSPWDTASKWIKNCATITVMALLIILVLPAIFGYDIRLTLIRPTTSPFHNRGAFGWNNDALSFSALLDHERNSSVTAEEDAMLQAVFEKYDGDGDGLWSFADFTDFMEESLQSDTTFAFMDSKTNDGYIDLDELTMIMTALDNIPMFHSEEINELFSVLSQAANVPLEEIEAIGPEVVAQSVYLMLDHGDDGISEEEWFGYLINEEWEQFNDDKNDFVDFAEFEADFFQSKMFLALQECDHESECSNSEAVIQSFNDTAIVHVDHDVDRRRLQYSALSETKLPDANQMVEDATEANAEDGDRSWIRIRFETLEEAEAFVAFWGNPYWAGISDVHLPGPKFVVAPAAAMAALNAETLAVALAATAAVSYTVRVEDEPCYDSRSLVSVLREDGVAELKSLRDVAVGDYVYDGNEFSKVYYLQEYAPGVFAEMLKIKYGVPAEEHSITLTPAHLLYPEGASEPVRSDEIQIGDVLWGITEQSNGVESNFTVYDISTVKRVPVNRITMSSDMVVSGIKTSVYYHSVEFRDAMHSAGVAFRWTSNNIDEMITQQFLKNLLFTFRGLMTMDMRMSFVCSGFAMIALYLGAPLVIGFVVFQMANMLFAARNSTERNTDKL